MMIWIYEYMYIWIYEYMMIWIYEYMIILGHHWAPIWDEGRGTDNHNLMISLNKDNIYDYTISLNHLEWSNCNYRV